MVGLEELKASSASTVILVNSDGMGNAMVVAISPLRSMIFYACT